MAINYTKIGWDTSKYVNPTNMNQMDNGIKAACDGVDAIGTNYIKASDSALQTIANTATGANAAISLKSNNVRSVADYRDQNGTALGMMGFDNNKKPVVYDVPSNAWKEIALADNVIAKTGVSGQTIFATNTSAPLSIQGISANQTWLGFKLSDGTMSGYLGLLNNKPHLLDSQGNTKEIALLSAEQQLVVSSSSPQTVAFSALTHNTYLVVASYTTGGVVYVGVFARSENNSPGLADLITNPAIAVSTNATGITFTVGSGWGSSLVRLIALA